MGAYTNAILQIQEKFHLLSVIKAAPPLIKFLVILGTLYLSHFTFNRVYFAYLLVPILTFLLGVFFIPLKSFSWKSSTMEEKKKILHTSKWIYLSSLATAGYGQVDVLMVRSMLSPDSLAQLVGGQKLSALIPILTATLITVLLPKVSSKTTKKELNYFFRKTLLFVPIVILVFLIGVFSADYIIPLLLGSKYQPSISVFKYYLIGYSLSLYITPTSLILYALNKEHLFIMMNIAQFFINIVGNYFLIQLMSADGAALTSSLIRVIGLLFVLGVLFREGIIFYKDSTPPTA
jgi:O-antigen/teichoic acid export membrane protein